MAQAAVNSSNGLPVPPAPPAQVGRGVTPASILKWIVRQREATVIAITIFTIVYFSVLKFSALVSVDNIATTFWYVAPFIVIGAGEVLMLVLAEIDLSAGQVYLTAPWFVYWFWSAGVPVGWAILIALLLSALIGLVNGLITVWLGVPSLIVTLAMTFLLYGLVLVGSNYTQAQMTWTKGAPAGFARPDRTMPRLSPPGGMPSRAELVPPFSILVLQQYPRHRNLGHHHLGPPGVGGDLVPPEAHPLRHPCHSHWRQYPGCG